MKFGRQLPRNMVPEWASSYINYKALKSLIKSEIEKVKGGSEPNLAGFFYLLDRNLEDVDYFYNKKFADFSRRLKLLEERYGTPVLSSQKPRGDEIDDLLAALLELRGQFRKLQWYAEVNRRGFVKITKKLDKKLPGSEAQSRYLPEKVDPAPFASNHGLADCMNTINDWLSRLGETKAADDASIHSSLSMFPMKGPAPSQAVLKITSSLLVSLDEALGKDDVNLLTGLLPTLKVAADDVDVSLYTKALKELLQRAINYRAKASITALLGKIEDLNDHDDINHRNCIHRLIISMGRSKSTNDSESTATMVLDFPTEETNFIRPAAPPSLQLAAPTVKDPTIPSSLTENHPVVETLTHLLDSLKPDQREALRSQDITGRTPLHYAAKYGFNFVCKIIIERLKAWDMYDVSEGIDGPNWQDNDGWAPLHLSVVGGHPLSTRVLLESEKQDDGTTSTGIREHKTKSSAVLALATKANFIDIVKLLVEAGVDINYQDENGETALHIAARFGHTQCAKLLIDGAPQQTANLELTEKTYSWTPLFIAAVDGNLETAELLINAGADVNRLDASGWSPMEHAALRGHLEIARLLSKSTKPKLGVNDKPASPDGQPQATPTQPALTDRKSRKSGKNGKVMESIKTFGHRYLKDKSMILVSMGSMDMRRDIEIVDLERIPVSNAHSTQLDTALSMVVSATGADGEPEVLDLPIHENTEPIVFHSADFSKVRIMFDLVPTYAGSKDKIVGRAVALLSSIKPTVGSKRTSLQGDLTVPIMSANTLDVIGSVTFNFLVVTPFSHPNMTVTENQTYWKSTSTMVIGHRGLGKNFPGRKSLQLGENTVQSFIAAANLGASYVEFDVQLTKDHVPVIYHDFLVSETGIDAPVHTLTLEQFLQLSDSHDSRTSKDKDGERSDSPDPLANMISPNGLRQRSKSVGGGNDRKHLEKLNERMKHTRDFKTKGYKGNTRGHHIQAPFATLEELFNKLPEFVGFNIELKYPMLHETELEEMDMYAVELNSFVDTVLAKIYDLGKGRNMILSSFNPDVCLLMAYKQPSIPVLFLTDAGVEPVGDIRASSLQEAVRFASRWNLLGIVSNAEPLVLCPRLVRIVKESGLVCVSYGTLNNDPENVKLQVQEGIDAVIVDSVLAIRQGLTEHESSSSSPSISSRGSSVVSHERADTPATKMQDVVVDSDRVKIPFKDA
ncbi:glycerophosphodiester phosphodiesterase GDE1 [Ascosphaera apis ARSEF 7405]|uniref:Glycerophosphodiester phosphodiesterase GDE1 n=1 Tax=Ascosphaera apis ARSEF 7405 TaxID=392613 RepID=A0A167X1L3_9EURO|nr:glycerophosphodiester phosphodiesterase GDE1 [Ascosphaera apis ARSEF 7405]